MKIYCDFCLKIELIILRLFEANMGSRVSYYVNPYQILQYNCIFHLKAMRPWAWFYFIVRDFTEIFVLRLFLRMSDISFVMKSVLNIRQRAQHCVQQKKKPSWTSFVYYFCYLCYSCYFCYKIKFLLFFGIQCYQMKCPGTRKINQALFFSYILYSCHTSLIK